MILSLTHQESKLLHEAQRAHVQAERDLRLVFTTLMAARAIEHATLVSLEGTKLAVTVPEDEGDGTGRT